MWVCAAFWTLRGATHKDKTRVTFSTTNSHTQHLIAAATMGNKTTPNATTTGGSHPTCFRVSGNFSQWDVLHRCLLLLLLFQVCVRLLVSALAVSVVSRLGPTSRKSDARAITFMSTSTSLFPPQCVRE
mmetsp:Transcript_9480/g.25758  ORF Transcript_9480/g.25758 Transcript_9480/m.25758 type:complete len:129 (-) Transcript_9480:813-1199(-)